MFSTDSYSTVRGVDKLIPVDVYLPGCPPKPEAIIDAIVRLRKKVAQESLSQKNSSQQEHRYHTTRHHFASSLPVHTGVYLQSETRRAPPRPLSSSTRVAELEKYPFDALQVPSVSKTKASAVRSWSDRGYGKHGLWNSSSILFRSTIHRTFVQFPFRRKLSLNSLSRRVYLPCTFYKRKQDNFVVHALSSQPLDKNSFLDNSSIEGRISSWLATRKLENRSLGYDYQGVEVIQVKPSSLPAVALALYAYGFNYLRCQCAYDVSPGGYLASLCYLTRMVDYADQPEEICIKVLVPRENPRVPSLFWVWKSSDFQERESYDMFGIIYEGHPHLQRILMPESWVGWPLRKDYITPSFYELSP
nr:30 kDa subunit of NADH-plastoquinone oxidoreductase [Interfilum sp. SAG 36.88]